MNITDFEKFFQKIHPLILKAGIDEDSIKYCNSAEYELHISPSIKIMIILYSNTEAKICIRDLYNNKLIDHNNVSQIFDLNFDDNDEYIKKLIAYALEKPFFNQKT
jgi:hypothetical protein